MTTSPDYGRAFGRFRAEAAPEWHDFTHHAFVEGLRTGELPHDAFLHYLRQDYVFLMHFARAWALAIVKADRIEEMRPAARTVHALLEEEIALHVRICAEAGIPEKALHNTPERMENAAYTRFVLDCGFSGDFVKLLAALAPCVMGYGEIGLRLKAKQTSETYSDWIETYAGEDYQGTCKTVGALMDDAMTQRFGPDFEQLPVWQSYAQTFRQATALEVGFWQMGLTP